MRKNCEETVSTNWTMGTEACTQALDYIAEIGGGVLSFDARIFEYDWAPIRKPVDDFLGNCT